MGAMHLTLPYPPSTNTYYRHVAINGRPRTLISAKGREYRDTVAYACVLQGVNGTQLSGRLAVTMRMQPPDRRRRDLDNTLKGLQDALTHAGVWGDDCQIDRLVVIREAPITGGAVILTIEEAQ